jgi:hypothetical protein
MVSGDELRRAFGRHLQAHRFRTGLSAAVLADRLGWTAADVVALEEARRLLEIDEFFAVHEASGLELEATLRLLRSLRMAARDDTF